VIVGDGPAPNVKRGTMVPTYLKPVKEMVRSVLRSRPVTNNLGGQSLRTQGPRHSRAIRHRA